MKEAPIPKNEKKRLASLNKINFSEESIAIFDRATKIATKLFNVPISTVTFVGHEKERHFSVCGLRKKEGSRAASFCGHAIAGKNRIMIVPDTLKDSRFKDNPMVIKEPKIRFYAGVVLKSKENYRIGTFCLKDKIPRILNKEQINLLKDLGNWVQEEINFLDATRANTSLMIRKAESNETLVNTALINVLEDFNDEKNKLEEALTKLNKLDKMEETILNVGHEFKSPTVPIKSQLQLLLDGDFGKVNPQQRKSLTMILNNLERLIHVIQDITDTSEYRVWSRPTCLTDRSR